MAANPLKKRTLETTDTDDHKSKNTKMDLVYRIIRDDESECEKHGLKPKDSNSTRTIIEHIYDGSKPGFKSGFISCTRDLCVSLKFTLFFRTIVCIDLSTISEANINDLTTEATRKMVLEQKPDGYDEKLIKSTIKFAKRSQEVLVKGDIPAMAVKKVKFNVELKSIELWPESDEFPEWKKVEEMTYGQNISKSADQGYFCLTHEASGKKFIAKRGSPNVGKELISFDDIHNQLLTEYYTARIYHLFKVPVVPCQLYQFTVSPDFDNAPTFTANQSVLLYGPFEKDCDFKSMFSHYQDQNLQDGFIVDCLVGNWNVCHPSWWKFSGDKRVFHDHTFGVSSDKIQQMCGFSKHCEEFQLMRLNYPTNNAFQSCTVQNLRSQLDKVVESREQLLDLCKKVPSSDLSHEMLMVERIKSIGDELLIMEDKKKDLRPYFTQFYSPWFEHPPTTSIITKLTENFCLQLKNWIDTDYKLVHVTGPGCSGKSEIVKSLKVTTPKKYLYYEIPKQFERDWWSALTEISVLLSTVTKNPVFEQVPNDYESQQRLKSQLTKQLDNGKFVLVIDEVNSCPPFDLNTLCSKSQIIVVTSPLCKYKPVSKDFTIEVSNKLTVGEYCDLASDFSGHQWYKDEDLKSIAASMDYSSLSAQIIGKATKDCKIELKDIEKPSGGVLPLYSLLEQLWKKFNENEQLWLVFAACSGGKVQNKSAEIRETNPLVQYGDDRFFVIHAIVCDWLVQKIGEVKEKSLFEIVYKEFNSLESRVNNAQENHRGTTELIEDMLLLCCQYLFDKTNIISTVITDDSDSINIVLKYLSRLDFETDDSTIEKVIGLLLGTTSLSKFPDPVLCSILKILPRNMDNKFYLFGVETKILQEIERRQFIETADLKSDKYHTLYALYCLGKHFNKRNMKAKAIMLFDKVNRYCERSDNAMHVKLLGKSIHQLEALAHQDKLIEERIAKNYAVLKKILAVDIDFAFTLYTDNIIGPYHNSFDKKYTSNVEEAIKESFALVRTNKITNFSKLASFLRSCLNYYFLYSNHITDKDNLLAEVLAKAIEIYHVVVGYSIANSLGYAIFKQLITMDSLNDQQLDYIYKYLEATIESSKSGDARDLQKLLMVTRELGFLEESKQFASGAKNEYFCLFELAKTERYDLASKENPNTNKEMREKIEGLHNKLIQLDSSNLCQINDEKAKFYAVIGENYSSYLSLNNKTYPQQLFKEQCETWGTREVYSAKGLLGDLYLFKQRTTTLAARKNSFKDLLRTYDFSSKPTKKRRRSRRITQ